MQKRCSVVKKVVKFALKIYMYQENTYLFNAIYLEESQNLSYIRTENVDFGKCDTIKNFKQD